MPDVAIDLIKSSPYQPRLFFELDDLKEEIKRDGLLSALVVRKHDDHYELLDGERRLRTLKELGWKTVPVDIRDVDDTTAKRSVFKLNLIRQNYKTEEKARYFKKLADEGAKAYQIGKDLNVDDNWVVAHINIFRFPEDIQEAVWANQLTVSHIQQLEPIINANTEEATRLAREILERKLTTDETRKVMQPRLEEIEKARVQAAQQVLKTAPEKLGVATPISLETPEDLQRAAKALQEEAKKRAEEAMTPEEKATLEAEKKAKVEEQAAAKAKQEEERRQKKAEEERRREERAEAKAREKYKGDKEFVAEALKAMPEEEVAEMLKMVPIPGKVKRVKSLEEEFDDVMKMASKVVDNLEKLKREEKIEQIDLKRFSITLRILADCLDEFAKLAEGKPL